jgi:hypothetical protein
MKHLSSSCFDSLSFHTARVKNADMAASSQLPIYPGQQTLDRPRQVSEGPFNRSAMSRTLRT